MQSPRRRRSPQVIAGPHTFDEAAARAGFTLDPTQSRAATVLRESDRWLYLTGPPGRGKSWLMDVFASALPTQAVLRVHWHTFIRDLHHAIRRAGGLDPAVAELIGSRSVVCFDEFDVDDPADGIFVARILRYAAEHGVRVVFTSNRTPTELMPNPLFHDGFLPTINLIQNSCTTILLDAGVDYRTVSSRDSGFASGRWTTTIPADAVEYRCPVSVADRTLPARRAEPHLLWVDFADICGRPLGATDYLTLSDRFRRWMVTGIPDLSTAGREPAQRFLHLVDVLYDRDIATTFVSDVPREYFGRRGPVPMATPRLLSRLGELG